MLILTFFAFILGGSSFYYLQKEEESKQLNELNLKLHNNSSFINDHLKSLYRFMFYTYGNDEINFNRQFTYFQKEIYHNLKSRRFFKADGLIIKRFDDIKNVYGVNLSSVFDKNLKENQVTKVLINSKNYYVIYSTFKPFNMQIVFYFEESHIKSSILDGTFRLFEMVLLFMLLVFFILYFFFKFLVINPVNDLLGFMENITNGKYNHVDKIYNTKEFDLIIDHFNKMVKSLKHKEEQIKNNLKEMADRELFYFDLLNSQDSILIVNDGKSIEDVNAAFFEFFDDFTTLQEFKNRHRCVCEYFEKEDGYIYAFEKQNWVDYVIDNPYLIHKVKVVKKDKAYIFKLKAKKLKYSKKVIITLSDITDVEAEKQKVLNLNKVLRDYEHVLDVSAIVSRTDLKGNIIYANKKFCEISGYSHEELIGTSHNIVREHTVEKSVYKDLWNTIKDGKIWQGQLKNRRKDGSTYYVKSIIAPLIDKDGNIYEYIALRQDVTDLVYAIQKANEAEQAKMLFLSNMSHEIRTPLNGILGFTELLLKSKNIEGKEKKFVSTIHSSGKTLLQIINDILDLSKIESGKVDLEEKPFNPILSFKENAELFKAKASEKNIDYVINIDFNLPNMIIGDEHRIKQVISNLVGNAIKFTPEKGKVELKIEQSDKKSKYVTLCFSVIDTGIGIPKEKQDLIFQEFSQADNSVTREFGGTGLGLSISSKLVKTMGSNLKVDSEKGKGSKFYFSIDFEISDESDGMKESINKLNVSLYEKIAIDNSEMNSLKDYLTTIINSVDIETNNINNLKEKDIIIVHYLDYDIELFKGLESKLVVLGGEDLGEDIHTIPYNFDTSDIFNTLIDFLNKNKYPLLLNNFDDNVFDGNVLIAEDNIVNQELIKILLDEKGVKYTIANNGLEAIEEYKKSNFDIIFMDVNMPKMDGKEATKHILEYENSNALKHTPIVALTANAMQGDREFLLSIMDDYISKPIDSEDLSIILNKYLSNSNNNDKNNIKVSYSVSEVAKNMGLPEAIFNKILDKFFESIDKDMASLEESVNSENLEDIRAASHKVKGSTMTVKLNEMTTIAQHIEDSAYDKQNIDYKNEFKKLKDILEAYKSTI
jgi:PAS domain S-box-containing protein